MWARSLDQEDPLEKEMACLTLSDPINYSPLGSCPWNSPGKKTGVGCHFLSRGIFPTQGSNSSLLGCRRLNH